MENNDNLSHDENPMISIICNTYNHEKFIAQAIEGFLMQKTNFSFEILIHDDASTDGTTPLVKQYEEKYPHVIKPIYQKVNQYSQRIKPRTFQYPRAKGKYIAVCEGDDYWTDPLKLQKQVDFLEQHPEFSGCYHNTQVIYESGKREPHLFRETLPDIITAEDTLARVSPFHTTSFIFRKKAMEAPVFFSRIVSADIAMFSVVAASGNLAKIEGVMSVYRKHDTGITASTTVIDNYHQQRIALIQYLNQYHQFRYHKKAQKIIAYHKSAIRKTKRSTKTTTSVFKKAIQKIRRILHV